jgi:hypothetical protein
MTSNWIRTSLGGLVLGALIAGPARGDETPLKLAECPAPVRNAFEREAPGAKVETVTKDATADGITTYAASVVLSGRHYHLSVDHDGHLIEIELETKDDEVKFAALPAPVKETFHREAKGVNFDEITKDLKYGVVIYESVAKIAGKDYAIVVAENGTLVEKSLVIGEDEVELPACPAAVQKAIKEHARGGKVGPITRLGGVGNGHIYETELEVDGGRFALAVTEAGTLISKAVLDDGE